jgi:hypothetical protein
MCSMASAVAHLLPQHDRYPYSPRAVKVTFVAMAGGVALYAALAAADGGEVVGLLIASACMLIRALTIDSRAGELPRGKGSSHLLA